jgi:hypothetical protein
MRSLISFRLRLAVLVTMAMAALPCFAGEVAVLRNGFSIRHERREVVGDLTRLYVSADGANFIDVPTADIEHYEDAPLELPSLASDSRLPASGTKRASSPFPRSTPNVPSVNLDEVVNSASGRYRLDPDLVNSVIKAESGFNAHAVSPKGAQGLMQLMPRTASTLGVPNAFDPEANVEGGTKYLRELLERYNFDLVKALAAYNAGPHRVEQFNGVPPYYETRAYVARIVKDFNKKKAAQQNVAASSVAKSRAGKRTGAKASTAAGKAPSSTVLQSKVSAAQSNE